MATRKLTPPGGVAPAPESADEPAPAPAPATRSRAARYRVICGSIVFPTRTARYGEAVELGDIDVANMLPLGIIEPIEE